MQQVNKNYKASEGKTYRECCELACINQGEPGAQQKLLNHYASMTWHLEDHVKRRLLEEFCDQIEVIEEEGGEL